MKITGDLSDTSRVLKERFLEHIYWEKNVSFIELRTTFGSKFYGTKYWLAAGFPIVFWTDMSPGAARILHSLIDENYIVMQPAPQAVYRGEIPEYPVTYAMQQYEKLHWFPVIFNPTEKCNGIVEPNAARIYFDDCWERIFDPRLARFPIERVRI